MMTMIKRVVKITNGVELIVDTINDFISNELKENEYVINIKYIKDNNRLKPYKENRGLGFETVVIAIMHIGELNNESS